MEFLIDLNVIDSEFDVSDLFTVVFLTDSVLIGDLEGDFADILVKGDFEAVFSGDGFLILDAEDVVLSFATTSVCIDEAFSALTDGVPPGVGFIGFSIIGEGWGAIAIEGIRIPLAVHIWAVVSGIELDVAAREGTVVDVFVFGSIEGAVAMVGHIRKDSASEAPFMTENFNEKRIGSSGLHHTKTVVGRHDATGITILDAHLEWFEVDHTERLLTDEGHGAFTVLFLFVDGEVLEVAVNAFESGAFDDL